MGKSDHGGGWPDMTGTARSRIALAKCLAALGESRSGSRSDGTLRARLYPSAAACPAVLRSDSMGGWRRRLHKLTVVCLVAAAAGGSISSGAAQAGPCEATGTKPAGNRLQGEAGAPMWEEAAFRVSEVLADGTLELADGRKVTLAGVYLDAAAEQILIGLELRLLVLDAPDRWGKVPVLAAAGHLLQIHLLAEGLAAIWPAYQPAGCAEAYARAEALARQARKGLWGRPNLQPGLRLDARDPQAVLARNGRFAIVEGRVESLGKARDTRYLNFGGRWATDFTVTFSSSIEGQLAAKGMDPMRMEGSRVRVRGVVLEKDGPHIEVTDPAQIEWAN